MLQAKEPLGCGPFYVEIGFLEEVQGRGFWRELGWLVVVGGLGPPACDAMRGSLFCPFYLVFERAIVSIRFKYPHPALEELQARTDSDYRLFDDEWTSCRNSIRRVLYIWIATSSIRVENTVLDTSILIPFTQMSRWFQTFAAS